MTHFWKVEQELVEVTASEAKQTLWRLLDDTQKQDIVITKHGRSFAVIMDAQRYEVLAKIDSLLTKAWAIDHVKLKVLSDVLEQLNIKD